MPQPSLTVSACPFRGSAELDRNADIIAHRFRAECDAGAQLVLFHECALSGYPGVERTDWAGADADTVNAHITRLAALTDGRHACIVGAPLHADGHVYNAAYFLSGGTIRAIYRKQTVFEGEEPFFRTGNEAVMADVDGWKIGLLVCFDFRFPELFRSYLLAECDLVAIPFNMVNRELWKAGVGRAHLVSRAAENGMYMLSCNNVAEQQNMPTMLVGPDGQIRAEMPLNSEESLRMRIEKPVQTPLSRRIRQAALNLRLQHRV